MKRRAIVAGNWKMNGTVEQAAALTRQILATFPKPPAAEVVLCPPFTALGKVAELARGSFLLLGAQNVHWEGRGAFTGEVSVPMLKELGCRYCVVGHSERRQLFGETDASVHKRLAAVLAGGLSGILCVGEMLEQRQQGKTWEVVETQLRIALDGVDSAVAAQRLVIAYEPVWAIGTGQNATPAQAQEVQAQIRTWLVQRFGQMTAEAIRIQYGGSVKAENAAELMAQPDVDGALVGGASLEATTFASIVEEAADSKRHSKR